jgi:ATP-binding cassette, subfamily B, bacterial MsbA
LSNTLKIFFRILRFAQPYTLDAITFIIIAFISTLFSIINFALLVYVFDVLFNNFSEAKLQAMLIEPKFEWSAQYIMRWFNYSFGQVIQQYGKFAALQFACFQVFISVLITNVSLYLSLMVRERIKNRVVLNARKAIFDKIMHLHLGYFSNQRKGDLMNRTASDPRELENTINSAIDLFLREPIALVLYLGVLLYISWQLTIFTFLVVIILGSSIAFISGKLRKKSSKLLHLEGLVTSTLEEVLGALRIIKSYNASAYITQKFYHTNHNVIQYNRMMARIRELASPFSELAGVGLIIVIMLYGGWLILNDESSLTASQFIAYLAILSNFLKPVKAIANSTTIIPRGIAAGQRIFEVLDAPTEVKDRPNAQKITTFEQQIEFKNVWFRYENDWVLKNVSFTIAKGSTVALVGSSGSGKSTIADLLCRFYDVEQGQILIDGIDIKDISQESLRRLMGIVTQEYILFNDTIANNIAFAQQNVSLDEVEQAAKIANAHQFIMQTPEAYQTNVGDRGVKLSGGQKQRISIARAVFKNPPIMILDEATSSLDTESEKAVQTALSNLMLHRTSLIIAHRLSTVQHAHQIIVLQKGEIIEQGTHEQLIQLEDGFYQRLIKMQTLEA